jgi:phage/plasmid-associated DNA primase
MIYKDGVEDLHDLLKQMEGHLRETMGFPIVLAVKEMNEDIDISDLEAKEDLLTSDEDYALYLLKALEGEYMYDFNNKTLWFWDNKVRLWRDQKPTHLRTLITKILIPYVETSPDPEVIKLETASLKSDAKQSALVRMWTPYAEERRDDTFIRENFDRKKGFLPIADNKIIDLSNGMTRPRVKEDYFTKTTENKLVLVPDEVRKEILQYYTSLLTTKEGAVPSAKHVTCLIMVMAYAMTGLNHLKAFINLVGAKDGGKSLYIHIHNLIMGEFGVSANKRLFVAQKNKPCHDSEMFNLLGNRMTTLTETSKDERFNEDLIKAISGGDEINIRGASEKKTLNVVFDTIMFLATNNMCQFTDPAFMSRLRCFNFVNYFKKDDAIKDRLLSLRHHFFTILVEHCQMFYANGRQIDWSDEVISYTEQVCDEQDTVKVWLRDNGDFEKGTADDFIRKDFFELYQDFWRNSGRKAEGKITFYKKFETIFGLGEAKKMKKTINNIQEQFWGYTGIKRREVDF